MLSVTPLILLGGLHGAVGRAVGRAFGRGLHRGRLRLAERRAGIGEVDRGLRQRPARYRPAAPAPDSGEHAGHLPEPLDEGPAGRLAAAARHRPRPRGRLRNHVFRDRSCSLLLPCGRCCPALVRRFSTRSTSTAPSLPAVPRDSIDRIISLAAETSGVAPRAASSTLPMRAPRG